MKNLKYLALIIFSTITILTVYQVKKNNALESIINESVGLSRQIYSEKLLNNNSTVMDSLVNKIIQMKIEQESYFQMLDRESNWFITYVTILFGIIGLVGYSTFKNEILKVKSDFDKLVESQKNEFEKHKTLFDQLEVEFKANAANLNVMLAIVPNAPLIQFLLFKIIAAKYHYETYNHKEGKESLKINAKKACIENLLSVEKKLVDNENNSIFINELTTSKDLVETSIKNLQDMSTSVDNDILRPCVSCFNSFIKIQAIVEKDV